MAISCQRGMFTWPYVAAVVDLFSGRFFKFQASPADMLSAFTAMTSVPFAALYGSHAPINKSVAAPERWAWVRRISVT